jgi:23S rRNA pseudouridine955/2504/2580 synthase
MRIDRWIRFKFGKIPQGLIEKYLRSGKIKLNKKKIKSSKKLAQKIILIYLISNLRRLLYKKKSNLRHLKK